MSSVPPRSVALKPYSPPEGGLVRALSVQVRATAAGQLSLRYVLEAELDRIRIPPPRPAQAADGLWKHTCFEVFIRGADTPAYLELNAAPSTEWALYAFTDYRKGMAPVQLVQPPAIRSERAENRLQLDVELALPELPRAGRLALSAVIESDSGSLSYWALAHPGARPDFHHPDGFVLEFGI